MTFDINQFKGRLESLGGPAKSGLFVVEFYGTNSLETVVSDEMVRFFCKSITMPGINFSMFEYNPRGFGMSEFLPSSVVPSQVNASFIVDSDHQITAFFHEWARNVGNYSGQNGFASNPRNINQLTYEFNYKEDYAVRMLIRHFSTDSNGNRYKSYDCILDGVFPTEISGETLSWDSNEASSLIVNFSYSSISFNNMSPNITSSRGYSDIEYNIASGQTYQTNQELVNKETRVIPFSRLLSNRSI